MFTIFQNNSSFIAIILFSLVLLFFFFSELSLEKIYHPDKSFSVFYLIFIFKESSIILTGEFAIAIVSVYVEFFFEYVYFPKLKPTPYFIIIGFIIVFYFYIYLFVVFSWL
jgi:hypothetical protein